MNRSQSCRKIPSEEEKEELREDKRATSHPNLSASLGSTELRPSKSSVDDLRRKVLRLNKELEDERIYVKQLRREKSVDLRHAKEEEQRRAASQQTELRSKLHKEKSNEFAALKEHMHKDKEKEILQIIKQKDDSFKAAQQTWLKEKEEIRVQIRTEVWNDAREETKKEFSRERTRLEQEIIDLQMLRKETEEALKIVQESDKRKADEIRRLFHEHEMDMEKLKRNSWQESRRQMAEIRQLLNIIEQLQRKLGLDSGHINKLRMDKENLYDELRRKTNTFDAWDSMMSTMKSDGDGSTPNAKRKGGKDVPDKKYARPRGQAATSDSTEVTTLKEQIKDHAKTIEELKQNLMEEVLVLEEVVVDEEEEEDVIVVMVLEEVMVLVLVLEEVVVVEEVLVLEEVVVEEEDVMVAVVVLEEEVLVLEEEVVNEEDDVMVAVVVLEEEVNEEEDVMVAVVVQEEEVVVLEEEVNERRM
ncbi:hypothetical protein QZH41_000712 [Actinostola sp. cb2023]|nr:hypothetical protein QZH41_000712 [Actinostola sp. cb2023]